MNQLFVPAELSQAFVTAFLSAFCSPNLWPEPLIKLSSQHLRCSPPAPACDPKPSAVPPAHQSQSLPSHPVQPQPPHLALTPVLGT